MRLSILTVLIALAKFAGAQDSTTIFLPAGEDVSEQLTPAKIYQYPQFVNGRIFFKNGTKSEGPLNYCYLQGEIQFISSKNDTLAIAKEQSLSIEKAVIGNDTFIYNGRYLQLVLKNKVGTLLQSKMFHVVKREKMGAFNQPSSTSAIQSLETLEGFSGSTKLHLKVMENITLGLTTLYYFEGEDGLLLPATKRNIYKAYPSQKVRIQQYAEQNPLDFKDPVDLKKVLTWLAEGTG